MLKICRCRLQRTRRICIVEWQISGTYFRRTDKQESIFQDFRVTGTQAGIMEWSGRWWHTKSEHAEGEQRTRLPWSQGSLTGNDLFADAVDHENYSQLKAFSRYNRDVVHELPKMAKKISMKIKNYNFSEKNPMSVIAFLKNSRLYASHADLLKAKRFGSSNSTFSTRSKQQ